jgi:hypothetical protein
MPRYSANSVALESGGSFAPCTGTNPLVCFLLPYRFNHRLKYARFILWRLQNAFADRPLFSYSTISDLISSVVRRRIFLGWLVVFSRSIAMIFSSNKTKREDFYFGKGDCRMLTPIQKT